jgi:hypothetical protein
VPVNRGVDIWETSRSQRKLPEIHGADPFRIQAPETRRERPKTFFSQIVQLLDKGKDLKKLELPGIRESMSKHIGDSNNKLSRAMTRHDDPVSAPVRGAKNAVYTPRLESSSIIGAR